MKVINNNDLIVKLESYKKGVKSDIENLLLKIIFLKILNLKILD